MWPGQCDNNNRWAYIHEKRFCASDIEIPIVNLRQSDHHLRLIVGIPIGLYQYMGEDSEDGG